MAVPDVAGDITSRMARREADTSIDTPHQTTTNATPWITFPCPHTNLRPEAVLGIRRRVTAVTLIPTPIGDPPVTLARASTLPHLTMAGEWPEDRALTVGDVPRTVVAIQTSRAVSPLRSIPSQGDDHRLAPPAQLGRPYQDRGPPPWLQGRRRQTVDGSQTPRIEPGGRVIGRVSPT